MQLAPCYIANPIYQKIIHNVHTLFLIIETFLSFNVNETCIIFVVGYYRIFQKIRNDYIAADPHKSTEAAAVILVTPWPAVMQQR